jgi:hypothetical protein
MNCKFLRMRAKGYGRAPKTIEKDLKIAFQYHLRFPPGKDQTPYQRIGSGSERVEAASCGPWDGSPRNGSHHDELDERQLGAREVFEIFLEAVEFAQPAERPTTSPGQCARRCRTVPNICIISCPCCC